MHNLYDKLFRTKNGDIIVGQAPNLSIILTVAFGVAWVLSVGMLDGRSSWLLRDIGLACFIFWGIQELVWGVNLFRRLLGAGALCLVAGLVVVGSFI